MAALHSSALFGFQEIPGTVAGDYIALPKSPAAEPVLKSSKEAEKQEEAMASCKAAVGRTTLVAYGAGHMLNDLTAACWFSYLLIFLTDVGLSAREAAAVMMAGQCADAIATLIVGRLIDSFGHFKLWHAGGSLMVALSFSSVFGGCLVCAAFGTSSNFVRTVSYSVFAAIFNCGWAATQVSHMSLVNCITSNPSSRVALNSCRNAFTMVANLGLYGIAYLAFWLLPSWTPLDVQLQFRWIAGGAVGVGCTLVLLFHAGIREPRLLHFCNSDVPRISWTSWFWTLLYYQVALIYMLTRLTTNISQAILPFFLIDDLRLPHASKALIPALIYLCSFLASVILQEMPWTGRRLKIFFIGGALLWILAGYIIYELFGSENRMIYPLVLGIGIGNALMLVTATSMEGILVANDLSGCAFVYGSLSFLDKLACGVALYAIEALNGEEEKKFCSPLGAPDCHRSLVRLVLSFVPSGCALLAALVAVFTNLNESEDVGPSLKEALLAKKAGGGAKGKKTGEFGLGPSHSVAVDAPRRRVRVVADTRQDEPFYREIWGGQREIEAESICVPIGGSEVESREEAKSSSRQ